MTDHQEAALDLLLDVIEQHGRPGPWPDHEPAVPVEMWRTALRTLFPDHANARQMVRRVTQTLVRLGVVLERDGLVAVGTFGVDIKQDPPSELYVNGGLNQPNLDFGHMGRGRPWPQRG